MVNLGTPTVALNRGGRNRLRLSKKCNSTTAACSSSSNQEIAVAMLPRNASSKEFADLPLLAVPETHLPVCETSSKMSCDIFTTEIHGDETDSDPEILAAMKASMEPKPTFEEALLNWKRCNSQEADPVLILINRNDILVSLNREVKKTSFSWLKPVKLNFSGEVGDDLGGLKRELFNLLMKEIRRHVGDRGSLQHNLNKLENKDYFIAGRYIVWSILHGGESCQFLSTKTVDLLLGNETEFDINDVTDAESKEFLLQLLEADTDQQLPADWLISIGISPPFSIANKQKITKFALKQLQYYRIHAELEQFKKGLECFGFLNSILEYREGILSLLCPSTRKLSFTSFKEIIQCNFSPVGSNKRTEEEKSVYSFEVFLQDCCDGECEIAACDILSFWTGSSDVPPLGFDKKLEVNFVDGIDLLPVAHTCEMSLEIPRGLTPDIFKRKMTMAVQWGGQFHLA